MVWRCRQIMVYGLHWLPLQNLLDPRGFIILEWKFCLKFSITKWKATQPWYNLSAKLMPLYNWMFLIVTLWCLSASSIHFIWGIFLLYVYQVSGCLKITKIVVVYWREMFSIHFCSEFISSLSGNLTLFHTEEVQDTYGGIHNIVKMGWKECFLPL